MIFPVIPSIADVRFAGHKKPEKTTADIVGPERTPDLEPEYPTQMPKVHFPELEAELEQNDMPFLLPHFPAGPLTFILPEAPEVPAELNIPGSTEITGIIPAELPTPIRHEQPDGKKSDNAGQRINLFA